MPAQSNPIDALYNKISGFPDWQQDIAVRIIKHGKMAALDKVQMDEIIQMVKGVFKIPLPIGSIAPAPVKITRDMLPEDLEQTDNITIDKISEIKNINALAEAGIEFTIPTTDGQVSTGTGLTIVYGRNGSGKSGFIRILKNISAFRYKEKEDIQKNCITGDPTPSSAKIKIGGEEYTWTEGDAGNRYSRKTRIFDSKNAGIYINGETGGRTEIVYSPDCFSLLDDLAAVINSVREKLSAEQIELSKNDPYQKINSRLQTDKITGVEITKDITNADIADLLSWNEEKEKQWAELKAIIDDKIALKAQKQLLKTLLENYRAPLQEIEGFLSVDKIKELFEKNAEKTRLETSLKALRETTERDNPLPGVCDTPWENLWKSAIAFIGKTFPADNVGDVCPLCMQPIAGDTKERIDKFFAWVSNDIKKKLDETNAFLAPKRELFKNVKSKLSLPPQLVAALKIDTDLQTKINSFLAIADDNLKVLEEKIKDGVFQESDFKALKICKELFGDNDAEKEDDRIGIIGRLNNEIIKLDEPAPADKKALYEKLKVNIKCCELSEQMKRLKQYDADIDNYSKAIKDCSTTTISTAKTLLNKTFLGDRFDELVEYERKFFGLSYEINFAISSQLGKSMQSLACDNLGKLSPAQFMSEGEAKVAALSCFLAEYKMSDAKIPLVFDDPITSLDHNFQSQVVKRLVELAKETQVIVFTHDFVFSNDLCFEAETADVNLKLIHIKSMNNVAGIVHSGDWESMKVGTKIQFMREELNKLSDDSNKELRDLGKNVRDTWEYAIEEILFNGTITRLNKDVKTKRLEEVLIDNEIYPKVNAGMTRTSNWSHSKPAAVRVIITKKDISDALDELDEFIKLAKSKRPKEKIEPIRNNVM
jgi:energy-coupling factor transporter ATP-binding protein EcfA2